MSLVLEEGDDGGEGKEVDFVVPFTLYNARERPHSFERLGRSLAPAPFAPFPIPFPPFVSYGALGCEGAWFSFEHFRYNLYPLALVWQGQGLTPLSDVLHLLYHTAIDSRSSLV